jgi:hypothetical protein
MGTSCRSEAAFRLFSLFLALHSCPGSLAVNRFRYAQAAIDASALTRTKHELIWTYQKHEEVDMTVARKLAAGIAEIASLGLFLGMVWVWAALLSGPNI